MDPKSQAFAPTLYPPCVCFGSPQGLRYMVAVPPLDAEQMCPFPLDDAELSLAVPLVPVLICLPAAKQTSRA